MIGSFSLDPFKNVKPDPEHNEWPFKDVQQNFVCDRVPDLTGELDIITNKTSVFYNEVCFPNYDDLDNFANLIDKSQKNYLTACLDKEIPVNAKILEVGCGTGQMSIFLSRFNRQVYGVDLSKGSLKLAETFRHENERHNVSFFRGDVFNLPLKENYFDYIISNGVLHHTKNARYAFASAAKHLKPGGFFVFGLYHRYGRLVTKLKQLSAPFLGSKIRYFDSTLRKMKNDARRKAWELDQFHNPNETTHTLNETYKWLDENDLTFINALPFSNSINQKLFSKIPRPRNPSLFFEELSLAFDPFQIKEGGFFVVVAKRNVEKV